MRTRTIEITETKSIKVTITPDRLTIKHNNKQDYSAVIKFIDEIAEHIDFKYALRGKLRNNVLHLYNQNNILIKTFNYDTIHKN